MSWIKEKCRDLYLRIVREKASPEYIARGWATGMFVGCAIPFGVQLYISIPLSFLVKGSKVGATIATFVTNPISILFIYPAQCWVGSRLLGHEATWQQLSHALRNVLVQQDWASLSAMSGRLVTEFFVGGFLFAGILTPLTYFFVLKGVQSYRAKFPNAHFPTIPRFGLSKESKETHHE